MIRNCSETWKMIFLQNVLNGNISDDVGSVYLKDKIKNKCLKTYKNNENGLKS